MKLQLNQRNGRNVLRPEGEFTIYGAVEFRDELLKAMRAEGDLEIDLASATEMDGAGLQMLLLSKREAEANGKKLYLSGASPAVVEVMQLCNVAAWFEALPAGEHAAPSSAA